MGKAPDVKLRKRFVLLLFMSKGEKPVEREGTDDSDGGRGRDVEPRCGNCL